MPNTTPEEDFSRIAEQTPPSLVGEFLDFLRHNKKWWLTPSLLALIALGALVVLSSGAAAPFIYTLF